MRLILPLLLLLLGLAGCAAPDNCALVPLADMPLDLRQNLMFVTAGIAGKPVRLLVDTGAERTVLTEATVARLGLAHAASVSAGPAPTGTRTSPASCWGARGSR